MLGFLSHLLFHTEFLLDLVAQGMFFWIWYSIGHAEGERRGRDQSAQWLAAQAKRRHWN